MMASWNSSPGGSWGSCWLAPWWAMVSGAGVSARWKRRPSSQRAARLGVPCAGGRRCCSAGRGRAALGVSGSSWTMRVFRAAMTMDVSGLVGGGDDGVILRADVGRPGRLALHWERGSELVSGGLGLLWLGRAWIVLVRGWPDCGDGQTSGRGCIPAGAGVGRRARWMAMASLGVSLLARGGPFIGVRLPVAWGVSRLVRGCGLRFRRDPYQRWCIPAGAGWPPSDAKGSFPKPGASLLARGGSV